MKNPILSSFLTLVLVFSTTWFVHADNDRLSDSTLQSMSIRLNGKQMDGKRLFVAFTDYLWKWLNGADNARKIEIIKNDILPKLDLAISRIKVKSGENASNVLKTLLHTRAYYLDISEWRDPNGIWPKHFQPTSDNPDGWYGHRADTGISATTASDLAIKSNWKIWKYSSKDWDTEYFINEITGEWKHIWTGKTVTWAPSAYSLDDSWKNNVGWDWVNRDVVKVVKNDIDSWFGKTLKWVKSLAESNKLTPQQTQEVIDYFNAKINWTLIWPSHFVPTKENPDGWYGHRGDAGITQTSLSGLKGISSYSIEGAQTNYYYNSLTGEWKNIMNWKIIIIAPSTSDNIVWSQEWKNNIGWTTPTFEWFKKEILAWDYDWYSSTKFASLLSNNWITDLTQKTELTNLWLQRNK